MIYIPLYCTMLVYVSLLETGSELIPVTESISRRYSRYRSKVGKLESGMLKCNVPVLSQPETQGPCIQLLSCL